MLPVQNISIIIENFLETLRTCFVSFITSQLIYYIKNIVKMRKKKS